MKINLNIIILCVILFSCNKKESNNLKIKILNEKINIPYFDKNLKNDIKKIQSYPENNAISLYFKIENDSEFNYLFYPISKKFSKGNTNFDVFPKLFKGVSLNNLIIRDQSNRIVNSKIGGVFGEMSSCAQKKEKRTISFFKRLGYKLNDYESLNKALVAQNSIIIPKKTTLYFESYISLPINSPTFSDIGLESIDINPNKVYTIQMFFSANDVKFIEKVLPNNLKKTISEGKFQIFNGNLYSNEIPLKIIDSSTTNY